MRKRKSPWIYMVYNWHLPVGCFTSVAAAAAQVLNYTRNWTPPFPPESIEVVRYRPSSDLRCDAQDITAMVLRFVEKNRKEAFVAK